MSMLKKEEAPQVFREPILYREWGYRLASLGKCSLAIDYFEKASKSTEIEDLGTLIGLCRALIKCMKYPAAERLSEKCMQIDPDHYKVKQTRVEALFQAGEFGHSLVHAHEGMRQHGMTFEHGVYQANETVEDCIGRNTSPIALLRLYPWIRQLHEHRKLLIGKLEKEKDELEDVEDESRFKVNGPEVQRQARMKRLQRVIAKMYMGYLAIDKDFLEEIVSHPEIVASPNKSSTSELIALASACQRNAIYLQDLLRMRRPLYVTLFEKRAIRKRRGITIERELKLRRNNVIIEADFLLHWLHAARVGKDYFTFFKLVDRIKDKFDSYSDKIFPLKEKCLNILYKIVAWAYIDTRNLTCLDNEEMRARYLKHHLGIRVATLPRDSDLAWMPIMNPKETLKLFRRRLAMASAPLELAWLHHEFCKFLIDIRRFDLARFYGKKGRDMAREAKCEQWMLNADHLILRIEIHQNNRNEARDAAISALTCARKLGIDCLIDFYERTIEAVDELDLERIGDLDGVAARQQLILELMPKEMKDEVDFLWRRMNVVPAERRFSVMPGCKPIDRKFKMPSTRRTILPSPPKDPEREARIALLKQYTLLHSRPGFVNFQEFE